MKTEVAVTRDEIDINTKWLREELSKLQPGPDPMKTLNNMLNNPEKGLEVFVGFNQGGEATFISIKDFMSKLNKETKITMTDAYRGFYLHGKLDDGREVYIFDEFIHHPKTEDYPVIFQRLFERAYKEKVDINTLSIILIPIGGVAGGILTEEK